MFKAESDLAERLAEALRHHQRNLVKPTSGRQDVQRLEQMLDLLQQKQAEELAAVARKAG